MADKNMNTFW